MPDHIVGAKAAAEEGDDIKDRAEVEMVRHRVGDDYFGELVFERGRVEQDHAVACFFGESPGDGERPVTLRNGPWPAAELPAFLPRVVGGDPGPAGLVEPGEKRRG